MASLIGRAVKIRHYPSGFDATPVLLMAAKTIGLNLSAEGVDIADGETGPWPKMMDEVGSKNAEISVEGVLKDRILVDLYNGQGTDSSLHEIGVEYPGFGEYRAEFFIASVNLGAETGPNAVTAEATLQAAGPVTFVPAS